jgi:hypothetical protein
MHDPESVRNDEVPGPEPASYYLQYHRPLSLIVPPDMQGIETFKGRWGSFSAVSLTQSSLILSEVRANQAPQRDTRTAPKHVTRLAEAFAGETVNGLWFWLDEHPPYPLVGGSFDDALQSQYDGLWKLLERVHPEVRARVRAHGKGGRTYVAVVYPDESGSRDNFIAGWLLTRIDRLRESERFVFYQPNYWPDESKLVGTNALSGLRGRTAMVIGAGTVGGSVALELAKAGIGKLYLVDPDHLTTSNLPRHEAGLFEVGLPKASAVARQIGQHAPWTEVVARGLRVGTGDLLAPARAWRDFAEFVEELTSVDVIVDATADPPTTALLNALALQFGRPLVIAWCSGGAWGGRLIRVRPHETACYECVGWSISKYPDQPQPPHDLNSYRFPQGCAHPSFTGAGFETKAVALAAVRMVVATIAEPGSYPDFSADHYVLSFRDGESHRERYWLPISTPRDPDCHSCGSEQEASEGTAEKDVPLKT